MHLTPGQPTPAGAWFDGKGVNFTLFSAHAQQVELCLFDANNNETRHLLTGRSGDVWHGYLAGARPGLRYGYRVHGPWAPAKGHRFNPAKLLIDPNAHAVEEGIGDDPLLHGGFDTPDPRDSACVVPKCIVVSDNYDWQGDAPLRTPWGETVIYEAHVRGLTIRHPAIPQALRGTWGALGHPVMIDYFKRLGISALELLPISRYVSEPRLRQSGLTNYWGYNPLAFSALEPRYSMSGDPCAALDEFRDVVKALHRAGIEVILDIVLNHTAELDLEGPTFSLRGIDNRSYYWLQDNGDYQNWTGCGNTLNLSSPAGVRLAVSCLRWWVDHCHVDGFRFDLATVMGRTPAFRRDAPLFEAMRRDPSLAHIKLIAEPWDVGPGGYQSGNYPPPFAEWNDRFRDGLRRFWLQRTLSRGELASRFAASSDLFAHDGRLPGASINFVTAHDGFTLHDCVSFNDKHNEANGEENRDGNNSNFSFNHGVEGPSATLSVIERRRASVHALLATLLLSQGTPMLLAGDEHGHSQHGNNNAFCQDNELTWLDWTQANAGLTAFTAALIRLRRQIPALTAERWWQEGDGSVQWLNAQGQPLAGNDWRRGAPVMQILLSGRWLLALNATAEVVDITLPEGEWRAVPPFAGEDNPVVTAVWHGPARGVCAFHKS
jgi:glycogen operon protein